MRINHSLAISIFCTALIMSCSKSDVIQPVSDTPDTNTESSNCKYLAGEVSRETRSIDELSEQVTASLGMLMANNTHSYFEETFKAPEIVDLFKNPFNGAAWQWQKHSFLYNTSDIKGNPIILEGCMSFIADTTHQERFNLESVNLYHPALLLNETWFNFFNYILSAVRPIYNTLFVSYKPEGIGYASERLLTPPESSLHARQAIDCELAALELLEQLGYEMADGYYTENMGMSNGSSFALATQKILENSEPQEIRDRIRLNATYCGEGTMNYSDMFISINSSLDREFDNLLDQIPGLCSIIFINCEYYSHPELFEGIDVSDYFSDEFNNLTVEKDGKRISANDYICTGHYAIKDSIFEKSGILTIRQILSPACLGKDGSLDVSSDLIKRLLKAFSLDDLSHGWQPQTPLYIIHSTKDDYIPYVTVKDNVRTLRINPEGTINENIHFETIFGKDHMEAVLGLILRDLILKKHPCPLK